MGSLLDAILRGRSGLPTVVDATTGDGGDIDHSFNGDGAGGAIQIYASTILFAHVTSHVTYNFLPTGGVVAGWVVFFAFEGGGGSVTVQNAGDSILTIDETDEGQMRAIYFDGEDWAPLTTRFHVT